MSKFAWICVLLSFVLGTCIGIILMLFGIDGSSSSNIAASLGGAHLTGLYFYKKKERVPTKKESHMFAILSLVYMTILGVVIGYYYLQSSGQLADSLPILFSGFMIIFFAIMIPIYYFGMRFMFNMAAVNQEKKKQA